MQVECLIKSSFRTEQAIEQVIVSYIPTFEALPPFAAKLKLTKALLVVFPHLPATQTRILDCVHAAGPDEAKWLDLDMLVLLTGRERTEQEFRDLYVAAGLILTRVIPAGKFSIIEGVPA